MSTQNMSLFVGAEDIDVRRCGNVTSAIPGQKKIHNCFADLVMGDDGHEMRLTAVPTIVMLHVELRSIVSAKVRVLRSVFGYFRHQCIRAVGCQNPQNKFHPHSVGWLDRLENSKDSCRIGVLVCSSQRVADQSQSDRSYGRSRSESGERVGSQRVGWVVQEMVRFDILGAI